MIPSRRKMDYSRALEIISKNNCAVLSTVSKDLEPYGCVVNYFYIENENAIYFHSKKLGKKISNIKKIKMYRYLF